MPHSALLAIAFLSLVASAISYFFAKARLFLFTLFLFYTSNAFLSFFLFYEHQTVLFYTMIILFIVFPALCLIIFIADRYYAIFCTDTSFVIVIVWLFIPVLFMVNFVVVLLRGIYA